MGKVIEGFEFEEENDYKEALKEYNNIKYVEEKIDMKNDKMVLGAYNRLLDSNNYKTIIGMVYLNKIRDDLQHRTIESNKIRKIPIKAKENNSKAFYRVKYEAEKQENNKLISKVDNVIQKITTQKIVMAFLILIIISMFFITLNSDTASYSNAKEDVLNQYASWKEELEEREKELDRREEKINSVEQNNKVDVNKK